MRLNNIDGEQIKRRMQELGVTKRGVFSKRVSLGSRDKEYARTQIMGVLNLTLDSFSGDGLLAKGVGLPGIVKYAQDLVAQGADIIDLGGESSRPGAKAISVKEELKRTIPVIEKLAKKIEAEISIDTYKPEVARCALESGASIVNDITGLRNPKMIKLIAKFRAHVVIMHMKGMPWNMQENPKYNFLLDEIVDYLELAIKRAINEGVSKEKIIIDPGIGFGKTVAHNLEILRSLGELRILGCPILIGPSRKSFIGEILGGVPPQERLIGTLASLAVAIVNGADIIRVHDVKSAAQTARVVDAIKEVY